MSQHSTSETTPGQAPYPDLPPSEVPIAIAPTNHGRTVAGWTLMLVVSLGAVVAGIGFVVPSMTVIWAGAAVAVIGVITSIVMRAMGLGQAPAARPDTDDDATAHLRSGSRRSTAELADS